MCSNLQNTETLLHIRDILYLNKEKKTLKTEVENIYLQKQACYFFWQVIVLSYCLLVFIAALVWLFCFEMMASLYFVELLEALKRPLSVIFILALLLAPSVSGRNIWSVDALIH